MHMSWSARNMKEERRKYVMDVARKWGSVACDT
jgi:hypothetical protein